MVATVSPRKSNAINKELKQRRIYSIKEGGSIPDEEQKNELDEEKEKVTPKEEKVVEQD